MLPPLGAALSASVDYHTGVRPNPRPQVASGAVNGGTAVPLAAEHLSPGRIDVLSLSAQLHLAQGLSIFAETVGAYLKISRREGESLVDYAHRLAEALRSLTAPQRAVLEQSLAQVVRGITLRMLIDILNNPLGPEAARLSAYMEGAQPGERDLAARAVVSSYRQNGSAEGIQPAPAGRPATATASAPASAGPAGGRVSAMTVAAGDDPASAPAPAGVAAGSAGSSQGPTPSPAASAPRSVPDTHGAASDMGEAGAAATPASSPTSDPEVPIRSADAAQGRQAPSATAEAEAEPGTATTGGEPGKASRSAEAPRAPVPALVRAAAASAGSGSGTPVIYDGPALARLAERAVEDVKHRFVQEVLYQEAGAGDPGVANGAIRREDGVRPRPLPFASPAAGSAEPAVEPLQPAPVPGPNRTADAQAGLSPSPLVEENLFRPQASETAGRSAALPAAPDAAVFALAVPTLAREGFAQPLIAYPPLLQPPVEDERDVERISAIEDEAGERSSQQHAQGDEQPGNEEGVEDEAPGEADGEQEQEHADHAQDLYWRMADLT